MLAVWPALLWGLGASPPTLAQETLGPHSDQLCGECHPVGADGRPVQPVEMSADDEALCYDCHGPDSELPGTGHPSGFAPARALPTSYPLDRQGRVTCGSCHIVHSEQPSLLRSGGAWQCRDCHPK